ncbi:L-aspartate oxidase [Pseudolactococcus reticulitermitis]|uniref:L-aspartate oxidase n=1 Tax=Pseudolactococcus reticulitermitis TaxID=2025039 RepID=A0A224WVU0_9LACT|nr:L-aspartate oxidase [Lactococcus reticulitermitis]GAX46488.1 L-aspartate oxidase [Lactococcus reticulitermitis]
MKKVVIIGSGIAGATVAYYLKGQAAVTIICKGNREDSNSMLAQGGIAAVMKGQQAEKGQEPDSEAEHVADTLSAGVFHNQPKAVEKMVHEGPQVIQDLIDQGMSFDRTAEGQLDLGLEGAHSHKRILHAGGDQTGRQLTSFIHDQLTSVKWLTHTFALDFVIEDGRVVGLDYLDENHQKQTIFADYFVLASGGIGHLFQDTSNHATITGDGLAMALRAGCELSDMAFLQFHPSLLDGGKKVQPILISEAVRGAGARLVDEHDCPIMVGRSNQLDLAPRDVVSRIVNEQIQAGHKIYLDISDVVHFSQQFPAIASYLQQNNLDFATSQRIPIKPGMHFLMGGVKTDFSGRTGLNRLYAVGEVAFTGVHGANRLASNSLLEGLSFAKSVAEDILAYRASASQNHQKLKVRQNSVSMILPSRADLVKRTSETLGIIRRPASIRQFLAWLSTFNYQHLDPTCTDREQIETANLCLVAETIAKAALARPESLGAHYLLPEEEEPHESTSTGKN